MLPRNITISLQVETINFSDVHNNLNGIPSFCRFFQVISCSESYTKLKLDYLILCQWSLSIPPEHIRKPDVF